MENFQIALNLNRNMPAVISNLAAAWSEKREYDKALNVYLRLLKMQPNNGQALLNAASCAVLVRNYDLARQLVNRGRKQKVPGIEPIAQLIPSLRPTPVEVPETSTPAGSTVAPQPAPAPAPAAPAETSPAPAK